MPHYQKEATSTLVLQYLTITVIIPTTSISASALLLALRHANNLGIINDCRLGLLQYLHLQRPSPTSNSGNNIVQITPLGGEDIDNLLLLPFDRCPDGLDLLGRVRPVQAGDHVIVRFLQALRLVGKDVSSLCATILLLIVVPTSIILPGQRARRCHILNIGIQHTLITTLTSLQSNNLIKQFPGNNLLQHDAFGPIDKLPK
mmetsp:Transcript_21916/g.45252  ORF Transcript_21916/g.45252 Transcript_21916/m.45252 type:complete len:202 (+) Transcript_21916:1413-2018(+)